jgi:hypothetical protein
MSNRAIVVGTTSLPQAAVLLGWSELVLTSIHHVYGAYAYNTPWRLQVAVFSLFVGLLMAALAFTAHRHRGERIGRLAFWLNMAIILIVPAIVIGVIEGGYNHLVKNIVFFVGDPALFNRMFPGSTYEAPSNWFFEITGVAQFPLGLCAGWAALKALRQPG